MKRNMLIAGFYAMAVGLLFAFGIFCASTKADRVSGGEELEGWRLINGIDYFYMRISGSASPASKESGEEARMKQTCIESTKLQAADTIVRKIVGEMIQSISGTADAETTGHIIVSARSGMVRGIEMKECAKLTKKWATCECVHYIHGKNLKKKFKLRVEKLAKEAGL